MATALKSNAFESDVLILNKHYRPVAIKPFYKAMKLLCKEEKGTWNPIKRKPEPKAKVYDLRTDFETYDWSDWAKLKPSIEDMLSGEFITHRVRRNGEWVEEHYRLPKIILLTKYDGFRTPRQNFNRRAIYDRDGNRCQYCGKKLPSSELSLDHVVPKCQGGKTSWDNIVLSCVKCNSKKAGRTPEQASMKLLSKPKKPSMTILRTRKVIPKDWEQFMSEMYWETELTD
jgi:5-methylcytosine-specific restriction endonuclease McrA